MHKGLLDVYSLLPPELAAHEGAAIAFLQKKDRAKLRHELLVCIANARRERDAGREEELHPLLRRIANLPPEVVREHLVPHYKVAKTGR
jgi:hypothetical protein